MGDPWEPYGNTGEIKQTNQDTESNSEQTNQLFDDNFTLPETKDLSSDTKINSTFAPLPDSSTYLSNLERKLSKLQKKQTISSSAEKRDFLFALSGTREGHIDRFLNSEGLPVESDINLFDNPVEESLTGTVIRHLAPHLQAVNTSELIHLLKADHLQEAETPAEEEEVLEK